MIHALAFHFDVLFFFFYRRLTLGEVVAMPKARRGYALNTTRSATRPRAKNVTSILFRNRRVRDVDTLILHVLSRSLSLSPFLTLFYLTLFSRVLSSL